MRGILLLGLARYLVLTASIYLMSRTDEASAAKIPPYYSFDMIAVDVRLQLTQSPPTNY